MIKPPLLLVSVGELQTFFVPQTFDLLVIDPPAFHPQQRGDLPVTVSSILFGQSDHS